MAMNSLEEKPETEYDQVTECNDPIEDSQISNKESKEDNGFEGCIIPMITFFAMPYAALYPLFWVPFAFTTIGFPVYCLYVWPFCVLIWLLSLLTAHKYLEEKSFDHFIAVSSVLCVLIQTVLTFYLSYPDL